MATIKDLAQDLLEDHPGIPRLNVSIEICESFCRIIRKRLFQQGTVYFEDVGKLEVKRYAGSDKKRSPKNGMPYKLAPRNVVKFVANPSLIKMLNLNRPKPVQVSNKTPEPAGEGQA